MAIAEFDYVIVGAGSAGCVLADRLSAGGRYSVLLLEAGGSDRRWAIKVPIGYGFTFADPRVNWGYKTEADPGLDDRAIYWPRGKVIGGSSSINAMAYVRGLPHDFDDWEQLGATGWSWRAVEPVYHRLETHRGCDGTGKQADRGSGPICVSDLSDQMHPFSARFLDSARDVGWPVLGPDDPWDREGLAYYRSTVRNGVRVSSADAFLARARRRPNLRVVSKALVTQLAGEDDRVDHVHYRVGGTAFTARARAEVVISAGAINSPQLLQLSGIGPGAVLTTHGIPVRQPLEQVGQGLQDHLAISHHYAASEPTLNNRLGRPLGQVAAVLEYALTRRGPLSVPINQVGGFMRSGDHRPAPDVQLFCNPATYSIPPSGVPRLDREPGFLLSAQPCRPTSRGDVTIVSPDPEAAPRIRPNSLATDADRRGAVDAVRLLQRLAKAPTLRRVTLASKTPDLASMDADAMLEDFRQRASTVFHPCCTCRIGRDASDSVVDSRLRVHRMRGLRVVDASAFPAITSGNTNAPTMMLAMRAADMILEDARP